MSVTVSVLSRTVTCVSKSSLRIVAAVLSSCSLLPIRDSPDGTSLSFIATPAVITPMIARATGTSARGRRSCGTLLEPAAEVDGVIPFCKSSS